MINFYSRNIGIKPYEISTNGLKQPAFTSKIPAKISDLPQAPKSEKFNEFFEKLSNMFKKSSTCKNSTQKLETILSSTDFDNQYKVLSMIKNADGTPVFTKDELKNAMSARRIEQFDITAKDIFAIATSGLSKQDALYTLQRIMTRDDLEVVRLMTRANGITVDGTNVSRLKNRYKFSANDIQNVRMFVMDSKDKPQTLEFLKELLEKDYKNSQYSNLIAKTLFNREPKNDGDFLMQILKNIQTAEQRNAFIEGMKNLG